MGLDIWMNTKKCETCGHQEELEDANLYCSYNLSPMWFKQFPDDENLIPIDGLTGREAHPILMYRYCNLDSNKDKLIKLNPPNGWGSYDGLMELLNKLMKLSDENPDLVWETWR